MSESRQRIRIAVDQITAPVLEDRRLVSRVLRRVTEGAVDGRLLRMNDVDPWLVGGDWANCALVRVRQPYDQSEFIVVGDQLLQPGTMLDREPISRCQAATLLGVTLFYFVQAVEDRTSLMVEGAAIHLGGPILYRSLLVPLSEDGRQIDAVLIAANCRTAGRGEEGSAATRLVWSHRFGSVSDRPGGVNGTSK